MKIGIGLTLLAFGIGVVCLARNHEDHWSVRSEKTIRKTLRLAGDPMRLSIDNLDGYVHVVGTSSGSDVEVTAHEVIRAETESDAREAAQAVRLDLEEKPGTVSVYYYAPWRCNGQCRGCCEGNDKRRFYRVTYDIDIQAPRSARIVASTINNGDVRLQKIDGDFDVHNVNGAINMIDIAGSGDANTVNGPIAAHFVANPAKPSSFKTVNGSLDLFFRQDLSADFSFKTMNGEIYSDFDVTARPVVAASTGERRNGKYVYRSNRFTGGRAGNGGPELSLDTLNGNIRLHKEQ